MAEERGAVEKVVETLFFTLLYVSNPSRDFFYAPLDGAEESFFGDSLAITNKVFAFEFKRSLGSAGAELGKYGKRTEAEFARFLVNHSSSRAVDPLDLLRLSHRGHALVALRQDCGAALGPLRGERIAEFLESAAYLVRLCGSKEEHKPAFAEKLFHLDPPSGLSLPEAETYFDALRALRDAGGGSGGGQGDTSRVVGFFVSDADAISIATADSYLNFLELVRRADRLNKKALEEKLALNASSGDLPRNGHSP